MPNGIAHSECANGARWQNGSIGSLKNVGKPVKKQKTSKSRVEDETLFGTLCNTICNNQIGISVNLLLLLVMTHIFFPRVRRRTSKFFRLSYYNPDTQLYGCGMDDLPFVLLWIVIFTALRVFVMEYLLDPFARYNGVKTKKGLVRFKEQAWLVMYCTCSWSLGMYLMYHSEFWFNLNGLWKGWPFREVTSLHKVYYLLQWAFYIQQIIVVNIEEKRKDYAQMFTHHIFTCSLIFLSYGYYHIRVGTIILCIMDLIDIILPTAKLLKYSGYPRACDFTFNLFAVTWFVTRHIFFGMVIWSIYAHTPTAMAPGCYLADGSMVPASDTARYDSLGGNLIWANILKAYTDRTGPVCWNPTIRYSFLGLLLALQGIICLWSATICKVIWKVVSGQNAEDARSEDEGEESGMEDEMSNVTRPIGSIKSSHDWAPVEEEVGIDAINISRRSSTGVRSYKRSANRTTATRTSAISIPGHGDRKELLGRIGCDKPT
ncbi:longevity assurance proteins LAG1/LAC1 [Westerdykella ornata]|uniref:Longevity assurance proteins LAG1/LAC1 n=1 Tax=Westerdykella ornata TaxID=318751 RepID=A0A6A6JTM1_WESOR|nr:longevity assurance proteins LAG1/LAC1 [Westerdykella ornata]KAF2279605.1 longevity assurance proteins LAG1/LAC1 [Westerdykella ornata]